MGTASPRISPPQQTNCFVKSVNQRQGVTPENFMQQIESYIVWYRDMQIKLSLGGLSPAEFRTKTGITI